MTKLEFNHISECWAYLDQFKTLEDMKKHLNDLPEKFGSFSVTNEATWKQDGFIEVNNYYYDKAVGDFDDDFHCVMIEEEEE